MLLPERLLPYPAAQMRAETRGPKAAVLSEGRIGFFWADEVGEAVQSLVQHGHDVQVLAPQKQE